MANIIETFDLVTKGLQKIGKKIEAGLLMVHSEDCVFQMGTLTLMNM